jgi:hypothetical protein
MTHMTREQIAERLAELEAIMEQANAMIVAADGYADDEMVWFAGHQWSASRLREDADDLIDDNIVEYCDAQLALAPLSRTNAY